MCSLVQYLGEIEIRQLCKLFYTIYFTFISLPIFVYSLVSSSQNSTRVVFSVYCILFIYDI